MVTTPKILLIEDDRLQYRLTQQYFTQFHLAVFELEWAQTYEAGLAALLAGGYTACLLDFQLGPKDGLALIREARALGCQVPIIFLTGETGEHVDQAALEAGAMDYLVKGQISAATLERSLRYALKLGETLAALRNLATRDPLTGLLNRRELDRILLEEWERAHRFQQPFALVMLDLDHFKSINDRFGHPAGDAVLKHAADIFTKQLRSVDRLARFGGEEFAAVLVQTNARPALEVAQRLCRALADSKLEMGSEPLALTVSAGVAMSDQAGDSIDQLIAHADKALYAAKLNGRNRAFAG